MAGIQTSAIQIAGATNPGQASVEYDGTNWTAGGSLTTGRSQGGYAGTTQDSAMAISGETPPGPKTVNCEQYNGSSWSEIVNVSTAGNPSGNSPAGSTSTAFFSSGQSRPLATEEFTVSGSLKDPQEMLTAEKMVEPLQETVVFLQKKIDELIKEVNILKNS